ncbi:hypothetical protein [Microbacterium rhizosphaerae]|uniref:Uncharacterized protein n=1 Tax=Microbacterium rhizosphaerae TaxID=1678237 RepID=A0ABZ0SRL6_9MICO|nr:hypothetical protein [Microbacterium rhizosphaerae]WPR91318.1 hypothetical protein SM116_08595 [Microbacterium rhizosphaerae]
MAIDAIHRISSIGYTRADWAPDSLLALSLWHREEERCLAALVQSLPDGGADCPDQSECRTRETCHTTR